VAAEAILERAKETKEDLWAQVVKNAYDAMEHAISAALARKGVLIPKEHPDEVASFINNFDLRNSDVEHPLMEWVRKRGRAQYVDIRGKDLHVPHEFFGIRDAEEAVRDARRVLDSTRRLLSQ